MKIDFKDLKSTEAYSFLQHSIAPRPICFASTISKDGAINLSPFSFFNLFSAKPPVVIFSPLRRMRNNTTKHTLDNILEVPEVVINLVDYPMVQQMSLASCEYGLGVNEFIKAGLTMEPATMVAPPLVKESKVKLECRVNEVKELGKEGGAGNLVLAEVLYMHIDDDILNDRGMIDQEKYELVARLGSDWYCRINKESLFKVPKPNVQLGIGFDGLPERIRSSPVLTGNDLGILANFTSIPETDDALVMEELSGMPEDIQSYHKFAQQLLANGRADAAWQVLLKTV